MFVLFAKRNELFLQERDVLTSGSVNVAEVQFKFSQDWDGLTKTAVFEAGDRSWSVDLDDNDHCVIPWEALAKPNVQLYAGIYGTLGQEFVLPTLWALLGTVRRGAAPGEGSRPPTPDLWEQALAQKGDNLSLEGTNLALRSGEAVLSTVDLPAGGGEGGTSDHRALANRDAAEQHPIGSISGLANELTRIPEPVEAITNEELEGLLK